MGVENGEASWGERAFESSLIGRWFRQVEVTGEQWVVQACKLSRRSSMTKFRSGREILGTATS